MRRSGHYETGVVTVPPDAPVADVADRMDLHAVGCVVVTDDEGRPLGIVTDRDLLRRVVALGRDPEKTRAADIMSGDLSTVGVDDPLERVLEAMVRRKVRRMPVVRDGQAVGIVALDDVVAELGRELGDVRAALRNEVLGARRNAPRRHRREHLEAVVEEMRGEASRLGAQSLDWIERELDVLKRRLRT